MKKIRKIFTIFAQAEWNMHWALTIKREGKVLC